MTPTRFGWISIIRIGLVQAALGAIVVLTTSTLNRVMVVELALPAIVPGLLVTLHHALQMLRPRWGYGSDRGGVRTPWIVGGMGCLAVGGALAALATAEMGTAGWLGIALAIPAYGMIGVGAGAAGTSLLTMLSERVEPRLKPAAATIVWILMIVGFVLTAGIAGHLLDPFSPRRLVAVAVSVDAIAFLVALAAVWNLEGAPVQASSKAVNRLNSKPAPFMATLKSVWAEPQARQFAVFIFTSMLAYSAQDLILEPFAGAIFGMTPGQSTTLGGLQHGGVLAGMILVAIVGTWFDSRRTGVLRNWMIAGCVGSALALVAIAVGGALWPVAMFKLLIFALGFANGMFAAAAIGSMMALAGGSGESKRDGTRIGVWGAAQAVAFGLGGLVGTSTADIAKLVLGSATLAYSTVFALEALAFLAAAIMAASATRTETEDRLVTDTGVLTGRAAGPIGSILAKPAGGVNATS